MIGGIMVECIVNSNNKYVGERDIYEYLVHIRYTLAMYALRTIPPIAAIYTPVHV